MEVGKISTKLSSYNAKDTNSPAFRGLPTVVRTGTDKLLKQEIEGGMPWIVKFMDKLRCLKGETGGIIVNALGTGLVAPVFIAFNPLSDADEDTKKYTALRQPVSAALAVLIQAGLTKPLDSFYDYLANNGKLGKSIWFNQSILHSDSYIKKLMLRNSSNVTDEAIESESKSQIAHAVEELKKSGTIKFSDKLEIENKDLRMLIDKTIDGYISDIDENIAKYKGKDLNFKIARAKLLVSDEHSGIIRNLCEQLVTPGMDVKSVLNAYAQLDPKDMAAIKPILEEFRSKATNIEIVSRAQNTIKRMEIFEKGIKNSEAIIQNHEEILKNLENIKNGTDDFKNSIANLRQIAKDCADNQGHCGLYKIISKLKTACTDESQKALAAKEIERVKDFVATKGNRQAIVEVYQRSYYEGLVEWLENQKKILESIKIGPQANTEIVGKEVIKSKLKSIQETISGKAFRGFKSNELHVKDFATDVVKTLKETTEKRLKGFKQVTNILVGLFITLPITCHALNWVYPRFMDIFFPSLSNNKKSNAPEEKDKISQKGAK